MEIILIYILDDGKVFIMEFQQAQPQIASVDIPLSYKPHQDEMSEPQSIAEDDNQELQAAADDITYFCDRLSDIMGHDGMAHYAPIIPEIIGYSRNEVKALAENGLLDNIPDAIDSTTVLM